MRTTPERTLALLLTLIALAGPTGLDAQVGPRSPRQLLLATAPESVSPRAATFAPEAVWQEEPRTDGGSTSKASWALVGVLGSVAGGWAGAYAGSGLGLFNDSSSEDPELQSLIIGAVVGSSLGAASLVAAVDGRDGSFAGAFGGAALGTVVGLVVAGALNDTAGIVAFSLSQALGAVAGAAMTD